MNKLSIILVMTALVLFFAGKNSFAHDDILTIPITASSANTDVKSENKLVNRFNKTAQDSKKLTEKTVKATKTAAKKTAENTKKITNKTVETTKDLVDNISSSTEPTLENLEKKSAIKTLKNEKKELKAAYNSRIKDLKAKITSCEQSTIISDYEKQNTIRNYEMQISELEEQRDIAITRYDARIKDLKNTKVNPSLQLYK